MAGSMRRTATALDARSSSSRPQARRNLVAGPPRPSPCVPAARPTLALKAGLNDALASEDVRQGAILFLPSKEDVVNACSIKNPDENGHGVRHRQGGAWANDGAFKHPILVISRGDDASGSDFIDFVTLVTYTDTTLQQKWPNHCGNKEHEDKVKQHMTIFPGTDHPLSKDKPRVYFTLHTSGSVQMSRGGNVFVRNMYRMEWKYALRYVPQQETRNDAVRWQLDPQSTKAVVKLAASYQPGYKPCDPQWSGHGRMQ